ncbi:hypothetical protein M514_06657 [Trichuris suis]|uniref:Uncharacterized protein n=1 Tax=Trichuris suis TaxID=68888 RepID=A0A085NHR0_9BILA|nr:hypothetical protein M513_06657 [Trichuris suis]KFD69006.1 hypothetical protein M514_06657 [Trichuris suis]
MLSLLETTDLLGTEQLGRNETADARHSLPYRQNARALGVPSLPPSFYRVDWEINAKNMAMTSVAPQRPFKDRLSHARAPYDSITDKRPSQRLPTGVTAP